MSFWWWMLGGYLAIGVSIIVWAIFDEGNLKVDELLPMFVCIVGWPVFLCFFIGEKWGDVVIWERKR